MSLFYALVVALQPPPPTPFDAGDPEQVLSRRDAFKQLLSLPRIKTTVGCAFHGRGGFRLKPLADFYFPQAIRILQAKIRKDPTNFDLHFQLGQLHAAMDDEDSFGKEMATVITLCDAIVQKSPKDSHALAKLGWALALLHLPKAEEVTQRALKADPKNGEAWLVLGIVKSIEATQLYPDRKAMSQAAGSEKDQSGKSIPFLLRKLNQKQAVAAAKLWKKADSCFAKAIRLNPDNPDFYVWRAGFTAVRDPLRLHGVAGNVVSEKTVLATVGNSSAQKDLEKAIALAPKAPLLRGVLEWFVLCGTMTQKDVTQDQLEARRREGLKRCDELKKLAKSPDRLRACCALSLLGVHAGLYEDYQTSTWAFLKLRDREPKCQAAWAGVCHGLYHEKKHDQLIREASRWLKHGGGYQAHLYLTEAYFQKQRTAEALNHARAAHKLKPDELHPRLAIGALMSRAGTTREQDIDTVRYLETLSPEVVNCANNHYKVQFLITVGAQLSIVHDFHGARQAFRNALRGRPDNEQAHEGLQLLNER